MSVETIDGLVPFKLQGDINEFENKYMSYFIERGFSEKDARDIVTSIWLFANERWSEGYEQGKNNPDFE